MSRVISIVFAFCISYLSGCWIHRLSRCQFTPDDSFALADSSRVCSASESILTTFHHAFGGVCTAHRAVNDATDAPWEPPLNIFADSVSSSSDQQLVVSELNQFFYDEVAPVFESLVIAILVLAAFAVPYLILFFATQPQIFSLEVRQRHKTLLEALAFVALSTATAAKTHGLWRGFAEFSIHIYMDGVAKCYVLAILVLFTLLRALDGSSSSCPPISASSFVSTLVASLWHGAITSLTLHIVLGATWDISYFGCSTRRLVMFFQSQLVVAMVFVVATDVSLSSIFSGVVFVLQFQAAVQKARGENPPADATLLILDHFSNCIDRLVASPRLLRRLFFLLEGMVRNVRREELLLDVAGVAQEFNTWGMPVVAIVGCVVLLAHADWSHVFCAFLVHLLVFPFPKAPHSYPSPRAPSQSPAALLFDHVVFNPAFQEKKERLWRRSKVVPLVFSSSNVLFHDAILSLNPLQRQSRSSSHVIDLDVAHFGLLHDSYFAHPQGLGLRDGQLLNVMRGALAGSTSTSSVLRHRCASCPRLLSLLDSIVRDAMQTMKLQTVKTARGDWEVRAWMKSTSGTRRASGSTSSAADPQVNIDVLQGSTMVVHASACTDLLILACDCLGTNKLEESPMAASCTCLIPLLNTLQRLLPELVELARWDEGMLCSHRMPPVTIVAGTTDDGQLSLRVLRPDADGEKVAWLNFRGACAGLAGKFLQLVDHAKRRSVIQGADGCQQQPTVHALLRALQLPDRWKGSCSSCASLSLSDCIAHFAYVFQRRFCRFESSPMFTGGMIKLLAGLDKAETWFPPDGPTRRNKTLASSAKLFVESPSDAPRIFPPDLLPMDVVPPPLQSCHGQPVRDTMLRIVLSPGMIEDVVRFPNLGDCLLLVESMLQDSLRELVPWRPVDSNAVRNLLDLACKINHARKVDLRELQSNACKQYSSEEQFGIVARDDALVHALYRCIKILWRTAARASSDARQSLFRVMRANPSLLQELPLSFGSCPGELSSDETNVAALIQAVLALGDREALVPEVVNGIRQLFGTQLWALALEVWMPSGALRGNQLVRHFRHRTRRMHNMSRDLLAAFVRSMALPPGVTLRPHEQLAQEDEDDACCSFCLDSLATPNADRISQLSATAEWTLSHSNHPAAGKKDDENSDSDNEDVDDTGAIDAQGGRAGGNDGVAASMTPGVVASVVQCRHRFHSECLFFWMIAHPTCPICSIAL